MKIKTFEEIFDLLKDFSNNQDWKMKWCLIHEMLGYVYAHLVLEVGLRDLDKSFYISYLNIETLWHFVRLPVCFLFVP